MNSMEIQTKTQIIENEIRPSMKRHNKQRFWQVLLPVLLGVVAVLAVTALIILTAARGDPGGQVSVWADTSLIWLTLPGLGFAIVLAVLIAALIFLVARILKIIPTYTAVGQKYAGLMADKTRSLSDKLLTPVIALKANRAGVNRLFKKVFRRS